MSSLPTFPQFNVHAEGSTATRWKKWKDRLDNLLVAMNIKDGNRKKALLLHYAGEEVHDIFTTLAIPPHEDAGDPDVYKQATDALNAYFVPKRNKEFDIYKFRQCKQESGETIDTYQTKLRQLAENCEFTNTNDEIKSQIIQSCSSSRLRRRALRESDMNLEQLLTLARSFEISEQQASGIEKVENVHAIRTKQIHRPPRGRGKPRGLGTTQPSRSTHFKPDLNKQSKSKTCYNCGGNFPHKTSCPAKGKTCNYCGKPNHFAKVCQSKRKGKVYAMQDLEQQDSSSDDEYLFGITKQQNGKQPKAKITINNTDFDIVVDTGATVNIIDESTLSKLQIKPNLNTTKTKIFPYGSGSPIDIIGTFDTDIKSVINKTCTKATIYVVKGSYGSLLSYSAAVDLDIIPTIRVVYNSEIDDIVKEYDDRFHGIGKIKDLQVEIHIDKDVTPVTQPHRRVPFHVRKKVEDELKRLEDSDIIEKVEGPTPWVSPIVVASKPKNAEEIRICVDMRLPNEAVKRERHLTPTIDDVIVELNGAKVFSKLDLNSGYHQVELHPNSRNITTFTTHVGLWRYKRLIFGLSSAAEKFQAIIRDSLEGLTGVKNISDDILVYGNSEQEHNERLRKVFQRLRERNITLNKGKCEFNRDKVEYFGYVFSKDGIAADPKKLDAIKNADPPKNAAEIRSLFGLANYVSRFIPDFATIIEPLRKLTHKHALWKWEDTEMKAFDTLKTRLTDSAMAYFNPLLHTELIVDASPVGLGGILVQEGKILSYASRALSDVEKRYCQTEKEALAIVWGCEHYHLFLFGCDFTLITDHKPLEVIFNNNKSKPPARIERWRLRLQPYNFTVKYQPGFKNAADYMSRHPCTNNIQTSFRHEKMAEEYLSFVTTNAIPKAMTMSEIEIATTQDTTLQEVMKRLLTGNWKGLQKSLESYVRVKDNLTIAPTSDGSILLYNCRIVIPSSLTQRFVNIAHEGHQGLVKTKQLLREKVWFPGMNDIVESTLSSCMACQASTPVNKTEPLQMTKLPEKPWTFISADFYGPLPTGEYLLVVMDDYSRFPIVEIVKSTSAKTVIPKLDNIFALFGIPKEFKTDNGPPFQSHEFRQFSEYLGFHHRKITPLWPRANGEAERFMRTIGKTVKAASLEEKNWKQEMHKFLRNYRATPHSTTGVAPATALFGRNIKTKLPEYNVKSRKEIDMRQVDEKNKQKMKDYSDSKNNANNSILKEGDCVLVKTPPKNKLSTPYKPVPYTVIDKKGSRITAENDNHVITRNSSHFKKVNDELKQHQNASENDETEFDIDFENGNKMVQNGTTQPTNAIPDRPVRLRKPPLYFKDYVHS